MTFTEHIIDIMKKTELLISFKSEKRLTVFGCKKKQTIILNALVDYFLKKKLSNKFWTMTLLHLSLRKTLLSKMCLKKSAQNGLVQKSFLHQVKTVFALIKKEILYLKKMLASQNQQTSWQKVFILLKNTLVKIQVARKIINMKMQLLFL